MLVGVPKEIKTHEYRVGLVPASVRELKHHGHDVLIETGAGAGIGCPDQAYASVGAEVVGSAKDVFDRADMIVKVKEPQPAEYAMLRSGQVLFTYLHLAADAPQARGLIDSGAIAIAYETVTDPAGRLPLLAPMSEVAGRMSIQCGAHLLEKEQGGAGVLLGGVPGVEAASVVVIDIAIDQGGCFETSRPTTHAKPTYVEHGVIHYCVTNMPGAVARTSAFALNNATLPFVLALANRGYRKALYEDPHLRAGLTVHQGHITYAAVAKDLDLPFTPAEEALGL